MVVICVYFSSPLRGTRYASSSVYRVLLRSMCDFTRYLTARAVGKIKEKWVDHSKRPCQSDPSKVRRQPKLINPGPTGMRSLWPLGSPACWCPLAGGFRGYTLALPANVSVRAETTEESFREASHVAPCRLKSITSSI